MHTVSVNDPAYVKGTVLAVADFPVSLVNGETTTVADKEVRAWEKQTGRKFTEVLAGINGVKSSHKADNDKPKDGDK